MTAKEPEPHILHIKLMSGQEIVAKCLDTEDGYLMAENPMLIGEKDNSVVLNKYLPFSRNQIVLLNKAQIIAINTVIPEFEKYYKYSIDYNIHYIDPGIRNNIKNINKVMQGVLAQDALHFEEVLKEMNIDTSTLDPTKLN